MQLVLKSASLVIIAAVTAAACTSAEPDFPDAKFAPATVARDGVEQNFELQGAASFDVPSTDGCLDQISLGFVEATVQAGLNQPTKSGFVSATVWTCIPGVDGLVIFGGTADLLSGDLYSDLPVSGTLRKTITVTDFHFTDSQPLQPPFDLAVDVTLTGFGDILWTPEESETLPDGTVVESRFAFRDAHVAGTTHAGLPWLSLTIDPTRSSAYASGYWAVSTKP